MAQYRFLLYAVFTVFIYVVATGQQIDLQTNEQKLQRLTKEVAEIRQANFNLTQLVWTLQSANFNLSQTVMNLLRKVADMEREKEPMKTCKTGNKILETTYPEHLMLPRTIPVTFRKPFRNPPVVSVAISGADVSRDYDMNFDVYPDAITLTGFNIRFTGYFNTVIYSIKVAWIACPAS